jgi:hypothetical protein
MGLAGRQEPPLVWQEMVIFRPLMRHGRRRIWRRQPVTWSTVNPVAFLRSGADGGGPASQRLWVVPLAIALGGLLAGGAVLIQNESVVLASVAVLVTLVEAMALHRAAAAFTPSMIPVILINTMAVFGFLFYDRIARVASVSAQLPSSDHLYMSALSVIFGFTGALTLGALGVLRLSKRLPGRLILRGSLTMRPAVVVVLGFAPLVALILGEGSALIDSPGYLLGTGPVEARIVGSTLAPVGILALAYAVQRGGAAGKLAWVGLVLWALALFSTATRSLALVPGLLLIGHMYAPSEKRRVGVLKFVVVALATILLAQLPLTLRSNPGGVGFIPFAERLAADPGALFALSPESIFGNLLFGIPLTGFVTETGTGLAHQFWTSVTPLPSGFTDWAQVYPALRVNEYTPYNGLGELGAQGWFYLIGYGFVVGIVLSSTHREIAEMSETSRLLAAVLVLALTCLFSVDMLQYNLRSSTRIMWYLVVLMAVLDMRKRLGRQADSAVKMDAA